MAYTIVKEEYEVRLEPNIGMESHPFFNFLDIKLLIEQSGADEGVVLRRATIKRKSDNIIITRIVLVAVAEKTEDGHGGIYGERRGVIQNGTIIALSCPPDTDTNGEVFKPIENLFQ